MHLKSLTLKGFKSFPDRTRLEFGPGVSVIVGPNGSGKSNVTDAVLWALGEQSPLAVRGASMQDVIFGGGRGVKARDAAEVELVLDNGSGTDLMPVSEISITRRLDRSGDGEYRLNGAKCRMVDVLEVLSDTGLGKEMHSVVSQGRIEAIVTSKPRDRRLLIEEAAGLGKHRKRRRRAQLKLERTQDNLDRALDVEREARTRLRPLKRQAEAAELHERLERQSLEARWELAREAVRARAAGLVEAEAAAVAAKTARGEAEERLRAVAQRREKAEAALAARSEQREALAARVYGARGARDKIELRLERASDTATSLAERAARRGVQIAALEAEAEADAPDEAGRERIAQLEEELARLDREHEAELERELASLAVARDEAAAKAESLQGAVAAAREALRAADEAAETARRERREAEKAVEAARRDAARVGAELAAANQFLRSHAGAPGGARALSGELAVDAGYELALAAALDGALGAALVDDLPAGDALLDKSGRDGGRALVTGAPAANGADAAAAPPVAGAVPLASLVRGPDAALALLAGVWVVEALGEVPAAFTGTAVTAAGRAWTPSTGELRQVAAGGAERVLAERNRRDALIAESEAAVQAEQAAIAAGERAAEAVAAADAAREEADRAARQADRDRSAAAEELRRAGWLIEQRPRRVRPRCAAPRSRASWPRSGAPPSGPRASGPSAAAGWSSCAPSGPPTRRWSRRRARWPRRSAASAPPWPTASRRWRPSWPPTAPRARASPPSCASARARRPRSRPSCATAARTSPARRCAPSSCATRRARRASSWPSWPRSWGWRPSRPPSRWTRRRPSSCAGASSGWPGAASSWGRSTRWPRTSTPRRSPTSRSSRPSAATWRRRCASSSS
jgi:chromosome segregation protein